MSTAAGVQRHDNDGIAWLTLTHTDRKNAITPAMLYDLRRHAEDVGADRSVRVIAIRGAGDIFSAGYDLRSFSQENRSAADAAADLAATLQILRDVAKPLVAVLNGHAIGAGCELAAACDIRWAIAGMMLAMPPARLGLVYAAEGIARFLALIGPAHTAELFFTARNVSAERAVQIGLVNEVFTPATFEDEVSSRLQDIVKLAPLSHAGHAFAIRRLSEPRLSVSEQARYDELRQRAFASADAAEGLAAFLEKRDPRFTGFS